MNVRLIRIAGLARCLQLLAGNCGSTNIFPRQTNLRFLPKTRGKARDGNQGPHRCLPTRSGAFAPYVELSCKWRLQASALEMTKRMAIQKTRWIRTYDTSRAAIVEIPLQADEKPLSGQPFPQQGCILEISKIQIAGEARQGWTLAFEAFGDLDSAPGNLLKTTQYLMPSAFNSAVNTGRPIPRFCSRNRAPCDRSGARASMDFAILGMLSGRCPLWLPREREVTGRWVRHKPDTWPSNRGESR
jgi:hypothetical protein